MFWDEAMISIVSILINRKINPYFMILWIISSGILTSILIAYHVPDEYRYLTILLISIGVVFSIRGYHHTQQPTYKNNNKMYVDIY